jgi:hypothetical protein
MVNEDLVAKSDFAQVFEREIIAYAVPDRLLLALQVVV